MAAITSIPDLRPVDDGSSALDAAARDDRQGDGEVVRRALG